MGEPVPVWEQFYHHPRPHFIVDHQDHDDREDGGDDDDERRQCDKTPQHHLLPHKTSFLCTLLVNIYFIYSKIYCDATGIARPNSVLLWIDRILKVFCWKELKKSYRIVQTHRQIKTFFFDICFLQFWSKVLSQSKPKKPKTTIFALLFTIPHSIVWIFRYFLALVF